MEDDKIKDLFSSFEPELSSDFQFMTKLQRNMEAVELVKQQSAATRRRNKIAVVVAALSGFAMGVLLTMLFPLIGDWISTINLNIPYINTITFDFQIVAWILAAIVSGITAINAYEITIFRLTTKQ